MNSKERHETIYFYLELLAETIDPEKYPFTKLIIENHLTREEYENLMQLTEKLYVEYTYQKKAGYINFSPLLMHFAGMLTIKLVPNATIYALRQEGYYTHLMDEFIKVLEKNNKL